VSVVSRRDFFASAGSFALAATAASGALARWEPSEVYPDPAIQILDPSFAKYRIAQTSVERIATGMRWCEGPVWFGDARCLLWSDIPNNRIMRWDEETGRVSVFRKPSNNANGNTRDRQGRLVTCEHDTRRVTRTEYDGTVTVLMLMTGEIGAMLYGIYPWVVIGNGFRYGRWYLHYAQAVALAPSDADVHYKQAVVAALDWPHAIRKLLRAHRRLVGVDDDLGCVLAKPAQPEGWEKRIAFG